MSVINFKTAATEAERDPRVRHIFETINAGFDIKNLDLCGAAKSRPFLSPMVWAIYSALSAITMSAVMRCQMLKDGLGCKDYINNEGIAKLIKASLPHYSDYVDTQGHSDYYYLLKTLDSRLLVELQNMLNGIESDKATIEQAAEILRQSDEVLKQAQSAQNTA